MGKLSGELRLLSTDESAKIIGITSQRLQQMRTKGIGPKFFRIGVGGFAYSFDDVIAFRANYVKGERK